MSEIITSPNNPNIKLIKSLHLKKYRDEHGLYFVEGLKMVREALAQDDLVQMLVYSRDFDIQELAMDVGSYHIPKVCVDSKIFSQISDVKTPQGIIGVINKNEHYVQRVLDQDSGFWVVLDRVQDPGNMGTIIRTVDAAGGDGLVLLKGCVDPYNPKTIRATMGSIFRVPIVNVEDCDDFFSALKRKNSDIIVSAMDGENIFNWHSPRTKGIKTLVIGNESKGISDKIRHLATDIVSIPIVGGAESLNASVAAGIMIYEIMRKEGNLGQEISCI